MKLPVDRARAKRIRAAQRKGRPISQADSAWLAEYESTLSTRGRRAPQWPAPAPYAAPAPAPAPAPEPALEPTQATIPQPEAPAPQPSLPPNQVSVDFGANAPAAPISAPITPAGPRCTIPNCPACRSAQTVGAVCVATGRKVWPPMSEESAYFWANAIMRFVGLLVKMFRADKEYISPSQSEISQMARAIREMQIRRASWIGAGDDIFTALGALQFYVFRAATADVAPSLKNAA